MRTSQTQPAQVAQDHRFAEDGWNGMQFDVHLPQHSIRVNIRHVYCQPLLPTGGIFLTPFAIRSLPQSLHMNNLPETTIPSIPMLTRLRKRFAENYTRHWPINFHRASARNAAVCIKA
jgi:hypothetical protein